MMGDNRVAHQHHQNQIQRNSTATNSNVVDMLVHSESPQIQEFRLYRELSKEIEKSSQDRIRYVESEIYSRGADGCQQATERYSAPAGSSSERPQRAIRCTTPQIGAKLKPNQSPVKATHDAPSTSRETNETTLLKSIVDSDGRAAQEAQGSTLVDGGNCQVCLIKELKDDLTNVTRLIQERNEQLTSKLKARRLRTFFERQMLD